VHGANAVLVASESAWARAASAAALPTRPLFREAGSPSEESSSGGQTTAAPDGSQETAGRLRTTSRSRHVRSASRRMQATYGRCGAPASKTFLIRQPDSALGVHVGGSFRRVLVAISVPIGIVLWLLPISGTRPACGSLPREPGSPELENPGTAPAIHRSRTRRPSAKSGRLPVNCAS